jgi:hypothetical protein
MLIRVAVCVDAMEAEEYSSALYCSFMRVLVGS